MTDETKGDGMTLETMRNRLANLVEHSKCPDTLECERFIETLNNHLAAQSAMRASAGDGGFAKELASRQQTPSADERALIAENLEYLIAPGQSAMRVDEAISRAPLKLRGLAKVIREHGTCAAAALEHVADEIQAAICKPQP